MNLTYIVDGFEELQYLSKSYTDKEWSDRYNDYQAGRQL
jgi:hypothetical protein